MNKLVIVGCGGFGREVANVNGRNAISWEEKFLLDVEYVSNQSFLMDLKILWLTLVNVLRRKDINSASHAKMDEFRGS